MNAEGEIEELTTWLYALLDEEASDSAKSGTVADGVQVPLDVPDEASTAGDGAMNPADIDDAAAAASDAPLLRVYTPVSLPSGNPIQFYEVRTASTLTQHLSLAVEAEGPIPEMVLFRRVARAWGLERTGSRITERLRNLIPRELPTTREGGNTFYWPMDALPTTWSNYRVSDHNEASRRHTDDVCLEELSGLALHVLTHSGASPRADIARSVCRLLGMARTPAESEARVSAAVDRLVAIGMAADVEQIVRATH
jgi:hypothetical protein